MAVPISPNQLAEIPKLDYKNIRPLLKTVDLVFCSGGFLLVK